MADQEPEHAGHTPEFARVANTVANPQATVHAAAQQIDDLVKVRNDELVLLGQVGRLGHLIVSQDAIAGEIARRSIDALGLNREATVQSTAALVAFKQESAKASVRLERLTKWLIAFTVAVVVLTVVVAVLTGVVAWHDLTH
jgi:hypothetical protein